MPVVSLSRIAQKCGKYAVKSSFNRENAAQTLLEIGNLTFSMVI
jgi:hypothetical protein